MSSPLKSAQYYPSISTTSLKSNPLCPLDLKIGLCRVINCFSLDRRAGWVTEWSHSWMNLRRIWSKQSKVGVMVKNAPIIEFRGNRNGREEERSSQVHTTTIRNTWILLSNISSTFLRPKTRLLMLWWLLIAFGRYLWKTRGKLRRFCTSFSTSSTNTGSRSRSCGFLVWSRFMLSVQRCSWARPKHFWLS